MKVRGATPEQDEERGLVVRGVIKDVTPYSNGSGWSITMENGFGCGVRDKGVEPKIGDTLTTYGTFGYAFHGQAINGQVLWYLTPDEEEAERLAQREEMDRKARERFEAERDRLDRDYDSLPPLFKMRIDRFRKANPDFRWESESYEMFVCTQAVALAEWACTGSESAADAVARIEAWEEMDGRAQREAVPGWDDGHSGNTHGCAVALAKTYVTTRERVAVMPGALAPIVGSADYSKPEVHL